MTVYNCIYYRQVYKAPINMEGEGDQTTLKSYYYFYQLKIIFMNIYNLYFHTQ